MTLVYNLLLIILFVPALFILAIRQRKRFFSEFTFGYRERLGIWPPHEEDGRPVMWFHCASLGEVRAVEPLLKRFTDYRILLTTVTVSGREYAEKNKLAAYLYFAPLDLDLLVARAVMPFKPKALVLVETELWPGLINAAGRAGARVVVVNARLSAHSFPFYKALSFFWQSVLAGVDRMYARSAEDAERFAAIGVPPEKITVTGNIKYDRGFAGIAAARSEYGLADSDLVWVCGSTRPGEEDILAGVFKRLKERYADLKLVIAPRHIDRVPEIAGLLKEKGIACRLRSVTGKTGVDCMIVDTFGELQKLYALSDITFVGGSLVDKGGQNPIEPASCGKCVLFGSHMENFLTEARVLEEYGGGIRVKDEAAYAAAMERLLSDAAYRRVCGEKARAAVESQKGALERTVQKIRERLTAA